mgnify:FL=1
MELSYDRCPRCGNEFRGTRCPNCTKLPTVPPRALPSLQPAPPAEPLLGQRAVHWLVRGVVVVVASMLLGTCYARCGERPSFLSLRTDVDGPSYSSARKVLIFLHGYGGSIGNSDWLRGELRKANVPDDVALVLVDGPFSTGVGRSWGDSLAAETNSVARVRALLEKKIPEGTPAANIIIGGFSQGAGIAAEVAAVDPRVGTLVSLSGCRFRSREALLLRKDLQVLVAHGRSDSLCSVGQSQTLVEGLRSAGGAVHYVEFDGNHVIPPEVISALAELLRRSP